MVMLLAGLTTGLLALAGGAFIAQTPVINLAVSESCVGLQVGSTHPGGTRVHLDNSGPEAAEVRIDWFDDYGVDRPIVDQRVWIAPWASADIHFRTPALGAAVRLRSSTKNLHADAELRHDDGADPERRHAFLCLDR